MSSPSPAGRTPAASGQDSAVVRLEGAEAIATSPEGAAARMAIATLLSRIAPRRMDTAGVVLPDGVKAVITEGSLTVWVYECPPCIHNLLWIAADSPSPFGQGTRYRTVRLALPYLVILAVFASAPTGQMRLTDKNEAFFRTRPLDSLDDKLCYPALLNCSRFDPPDHRPLSWICTQHLERTAKMNDADPNVSMRASFESLRRCLLETGFNLSSEHHETSSWYTESCRVDNRLSPVEKWQAASIRDPLFVLDVPWLDTKMSVRQIAARIRDNMRVPIGRYDSASAVARLIFNQRSPRAAKVADLMHMMEIAF